MVWVVLPFFTVILLLSTVPMASLKVRTTFVRSPEAFAADSVGFTPSTLCPESIVTASWVRSALTVVEPASLIVPLLSVSLFAAIAMPFGAELFSTTVWLHTSLVVSVPWAAQSAVVSVPSKSSSSRGVPVMSTASLKVTVASTTSPMA